ncbi:uncharacterized protein BO97DRAFT_452704 [Aspergillus homomorphus CBS 101889]|uniref:Zn(2)-C6 fungal-type domain-containing protein n=1 Tax=Aspergillus homomorphus (strain CBS 101889) TaxID=1450537 RepID=A0A395I9F5_ASPHC|nr:hypothetical protein BO97DRAFT_452704 [Aspergillus homomorphus CBS 101889]RAL16797.1 hypothetical protein BO97DRAFT_452704 [Aspergillus homomorphus CBS 101889]
MSSSATSPNSAIQNQSRRKMSQVPRQSKLRSSCDQCGTAKVKCDRAQPECSRCISHGMQCVYGVSRKMGKPPRRANLFPSTTGATPQMGDSGSNCDAGRTLLDVEIFADPACDALNTALDNALDDRQPLNHSNHPTSENLFDHQGSIESFYQDLPGAFLSSIPSLDMEGWLAAADAPFSSESPWDELPEVTPSLPIDRGHNCSREAHSIFHSLSSLGTKEATSPMPDTPGGGGQVPLDLVLRLSREAAARLVPFLSCACARSPHLALLYAAIIARILAWYQRAAGYSPRASPPASSSASSRRSPLTPFSNVTMAPARIAIGTFSVDDSQLETAVKMQLLSGELKRLGALIDQFTLQDPGRQCQNEEDPFGDADSLYRCLQMWLKQDYARVKSLLRYELQELNT